MTTTAASNARAHAVNSTMFGVGELERWMNDPTVSEVMVNAGRDVWIERRPTGDADRMQQPPRSARGRHHGPDYIGRLGPGVIETVIERILTPIGRRLDRASPMVDARLADGSRVCAVLSPIAVDGPCLAVRRFPNHALGLDDFASAPVVLLLQRLVALRCNIVVSGATSSGKTSMLNALASLIGEHERIISLEDTAELRIAAPHVLRLETRPGTPDGLSAVDMATLLRTALRLRPDRLVVGEIRGDEAVELIQALNTGHDGSLATVHANTALEALARLESLVVRASGGWPLVAVREQVERSIDVIVHLRRDDQGRRLVAEVAEVVATDDVEAAESGASGGAGRMRRLADHNSVVAEIRRGRR